MSVEASVAAVLCSGSNLCSGSISCCGCGRQRDVLWLPVQMKWMALVLCHILLDDLGGPHRSNAHMIISAHSSCMLGLSIAPVLADLQPDCCLKWSEATDPSLWVWPAISMQLLLLMSLLLDRYLCGSMLGCHQGPLALRGVRRSLLSSGRQVLSLPPFSGASFAKQQLFAC